MTFAQKFAFACIASQLFVGLLILLWERKK